MLLLLVALLHAQSQMAREAEGNSILYFFYNNMAKKLYVGNLPWGTKRETLESVINSQMEAAVNALKKLEQK